MLNKIMLEQFGFMFLSFTSGNGESRYFWKKDGAISELTFEVAADAVYAAGYLAKDRLDLVVCTNCSTVHDLATMPCTKKISGRNRSAPDSCPACTGVFLQQIKNPDWVLVVDFFGLDTSFQWDIARVIEYSKLYEECTVSISTQEFGSSHFDSPVSSKGML